MSEERDLSSVTVEEFQGLSLRDRNRLLLADPDRYRMLRDGDPRRDAAIKAARAVLRETLDSTPGLTYREQELR